MVVRTVEPRGDDGDGSVGAGVAIDGAGVDSVVVDSVIGNSAALMVSGVVAVRKGKVSEMEHLR
jgi:hypothetical protein